MRLLLASKSAARRQMLEAAGVPFQTVEASLDEERAKAELAGLGAAELAHALAERKALSAEAGSHDIVLGSDQTLEREDGSILSKAGSREELAEQLLSLKGRSHRLHSGAVLVDEGMAVWSAVETVTIRMRDFSDAFLDHYLDRQFEAVRWSVGGYHAEGMGVQLLESIEGSHFAVLGMPLLPLLGGLRMHGVIQS